MEFTSGRSSGQIVATIIIIDFLEVGNRELHVLQKTNGIHPTSQRTSSKTELAGWQTPSNNEIGTSVASIVLVRQEQS